MKERLPGGGDCRGRLEECLRQSPFAEMGRDMKDNVRAVARALLGRMDIVTRAEFEEQNAILAAAVARLEELKAELEALKKPPAEK